MLDPVYRRRHISHQSHLIFFILFIFGVSPWWAAGQQTVDQKVPLTYTKPPSGAKVLQVDRIEGQVVFTPEGTKGLFPASGVQIALFSEKQETVSTTVSSSGGQFEIKEVAPGAYTLVVGGDMFCPLSIPLRVSASTSERVSMSEHAHTVSALLLSMRSKTDKHKSVVTPITNSGLRTELLERVAKDQAIRQEWIKSGVDHPNKEIDARMAAIDAENLARMKEIVQQYRWPGPALVGVDGTEAAFLLLQHAPYAFQKEMLPQIRSAYRSGKLQGQDYALLMDRVLVREGKPQVYGTQARPVTEWKNGEPAFDPIEDEAHVDQRRAEVELFSLTEYRQMLKDIYFPKAQPKP